MTHYAIVFVDINFWCVSMYNVIIHNEIYMDSSPGWMWICTYYIALLSVILLMN